MRKIEYYLSIERTKERKSERERKNRKRMHACTEKSTHETKNVNNVKCRYSWSVLLAHNVSASSRVRLYTYYRCREL